MATIHCDNFVGNAWKKDLCLNCFKSKEDHVVKNGFSQPVAPTKIPDPPKEGILKGTKSKSSNPKQNKVFFLSTEFEVIGFGGDDSYSDDDYPDSAMDVKDNDDDDAEDSEEDKAFQLLTKTNTDFNSITENLQEPKKGEVKKIIEPLKLGKQLFDDKGNKKTLLVSVTPFGDQTGGGNRINVNGIKSSMAIVNELKSNNNASEVKKDAIPVGKVKPINKKTDTNSNGEVSEEKSTKANGVNGDVLESEKIENDIAQTNEKDSPNKAPSEKSLKRSQPVDKSFKFRLIKDLQRENEKNFETCDKDENQSKSDKRSDKVSHLIDKAKKKVNQFPVINDNTNFKFKSKDLTNFSGKKVGENNKDVVLDIYNIREKEVVKTNNEINEEKTIKGIMVVPEIRNKFLSKEVKVSTNLVDMPREESILSDSVTNSISPENQTSKEKYEPIQNVSTIDRTKLIPNVSSIHRNRIANTLLKKDTEQKPEIINTFPRTLMNGVVSSLTPATERLKEEDNVKNCDVNSEIKNIYENVVKNKEVVSEVHQTKRQTYSLEKEPQKENDKGNKWGNEDRLMACEAEKQSDIVQLDNEDSINKSEGEPVGQVDSSNSPSPPALPSRPPPLLVESRTAFLHDFSMDGDFTTITPEKPKVPAKPILIQSKRTNFQSPIHTNRPRSPSMEKFLDGTPLPLIKSLPDTSSPDNGKNQKRPAPKPPSPKDDLSHRYEEIFSDLDSSEIELKNAEFDEETVKRVFRSSENLLEFITDQEEKNQLIAEGLEEVPGPEPAPRRSLSLSQDSLVPSDPGDIQGKKKISKGKVFLQKLLHFGKPKEAMKEFSPRQRTSTPLTSKPKLEIIHPNDLSGSRVEVVPPARTFKSRRTSSSASSSSGELRESDVLSDSSTSHSVSSTGNDSSSTSDRPKKPPPPPRAQSLETWNVKPARPPPPKSIETLRQMNSSWCNTVEKKTDSLYANLGEARSGLAPNKPIRTGSLREANVDNFKRLPQVTSQPEDSDYESFVVPSTSPLIEDNLYESVQSANHRSSLPECDSLAECPNLSFIKGKKSHVTRDLLHRRSEGNVELNSDFKMKFLRSVSLPYCASETESEIYSPYSFCGSELCEEDYEVSSSNQILRISRLKLKKGRSIVHKNLEDNYGAVVVANHEALAQVVENMRQGPAIPPALRALSTAVNLRWTDFVIGQDVAGVVVERRIFYPALWGIHNVTLSLMAEQGQKSSLHAKGPFSLNPIAELNDLVPSSYLPMLKKQDSDPIQASISVLTRLQIETLESYGKNMKVSNLSEESKKEVNFVLLQIINAFKTLQAQGIEEASKNLTNLVVCREEKDPHPRICITDSSERSENRTSLCQCLIHAIREILPVTDLTSLLSCVLLKEKAVSLSQAKGILEFILWGPADIVFGNSNKERESALQRWLDLERATVLHGLVRTRAELTVFEEWQLLFLVRTSSKIMAEASLLLECGIEENVSTA